MAVLAVALMGALPARGSFDEPTAVRTSQQAIGHRVRNVTFTTSNGTPLQLAQLLGKPIVISMIYTSCSGVCPMTTRRLASAVRVARGALGPSGFNVLSVGFDTVHDTAASLRAFATEQQIHDPSWWFVTAGNEDIARLAEDTGFWFAPGSGIFDHLVQTTLLDGRGRVVWQVYGNDFDALQLAEPLRRTALGAPLGGSSLSSLVNRARLLCTVYDVRLGRYRVDYSLALSLLIAMSTLLALAVILVRAWRSAPHRGAA